VSQCKESNCLTQSNGVNKLVGTKYVIVVLFLEFVAQRARNPKGEKKKIKQFLSVCLSLALHELQTTMCASNNTFCTSFFVQAIAKLN